MVNLTVSKALFEQFENLKIGLVIIKGFDNNLNPEILDKIKQVQEEIKKTLEKSKLAELEVINTWRRAYSSFGAKPKKYKSSIEALLRRVLDGEDLPSINNLVNIYNYISLKYKLPLGADDIDLLKTLPSGEVQLTYAKGDETFKAIGSDEIKSPGQGEIVYKAGDNVLCRRWNWRESDLTKITEKTSNAVLYCESLLSDSSVLNEALSELQSLVGGEIRIIDANNNSIDLETLELSNVDFNESFTKEKLPAKKETTEVAKVEKNLAKNGKQNGQNNKGKDAKVAIVHWADVFAEKIIRLRGDKDEYVIESGITPSGMIHVGNFREVITADLVRRALEKRGKKVNFLYVWDDYDVLRKVPTNLPKQDMIKENLRKPVFLVPDPFGCHDTYAEHFEKTFEAESSLVGIKATFVYSHKHYLACEYSEEIKTALEKTEKIKEILNKFRRAPLADDWLPIFVFCDKCKRDTITKIHWEKGYEVDYECECGNKNTVDFRKKGIVTLRWRVDWPMRWFHNKIDFETAGKDHFAAGGSVDTGIKLLEAVYEVPAPAGIATKDFYEWIGIKGRGQFASSSGNVVTITEMLEVYEPEIVRYLFAGTRPNREFSISFDADVFAIYEEFDKCERAYFGLGEMNDKKREKLKVAYELSVVEKAPEKMPYQPSLRHLSTLVQINNFNIDKTVKYFEKELKSEFDKKRLRKRAECASNWIKKHASEEFKFTVQEESQVTLADEEKKLLHELAEKLQEREWTDIELHEEMYILCKNNEFESKDFFNVAYRVLINKSKGPRLASFILEIGRERVAELFKKV